jgi:HK97 family phage prohead protease
VSEILLRHDGTIGAVDKKLRLIDLIAVPWDQEAEVFWRGEMWREVVKRGAFDGIESRAGQVRVNREHVVGKTVGKIVEFDPAHTDGLFTVVKVAKGPAGDEVLNLAEDDMISASIGYQAQKPSDVQIDRQGRSRVVVKAWLNHLGMVEAPTWDSARVLAVRMDESGHPVAEDPLPATPLLDEYVNDPLWQWARGLSSDQ